VTVTNDIVFNDLRNARPGIAQRQRLHGRQVEHLPIGEQVVDAGQRVDRVQEFRPDFCGTFLSLWELRINGEAKGPMIHWSLPGIGA
jgi:hypothetical protein